MSASLFPRNPDALIEGARKDFLRYGDHIAQGKDVRHVLPSVRYWLMNAFRFHQKHKWRLTQTPEFRFFALALHARLRRNLPAHERVWQKRTGFYDIRATVLAEQGMNALHKLLGPPEEVL